MDPRHIAALWGSADFHAELDDEEAARYRGAPADVHLRDLVDVCRLATNLVRSQPPDLRERTLAYQDPVGDREAQLWLERVRETRRPRGRP